MLIIDKSSSSFLLDKHTGLSAATITSARLQGARRVACDDRISLYVCDRDDGYAWLVVSESVPT